MQRFVIFDDIVMAVTVRPWTGPFAIEKVRKGEVLKLNCGCLQLLVVSVGSDDHSGEPYVHSTAYGYGVL